MCVEEVTVRKRSTIINFHDNTFSQNFKEFAKKHPWWVSLLVRVRLS